MSDAPHDADEAVRDPDPGGLAGVGADAATGTPGIPNVDGLAIAVDLVGQRWALLIVRELLAGPRRFVDLQRALPGIPTNILTTRLKEFQASGIAYRIPLAHRSLAYHLTERGQALADAVTELARWGEQVGAVAAPPSHEDPPVPAAPTTGTEGATAGG